ncbi:MAG: hypothetical protein RMJ51_06850 [Candidatus Calescibacterium sp.]|nr:hypothetical protein [Candidatus Calescibacterium sp.]MCX7972346.1 hypothetical protein [bacterium]MDW8195933.1 hypothetical protein [Candidatus Calescibacterium sp.]
MKKLFIILFISSFLFFIFSCQKNNLKTYDSSLIGTLRIEKIKESKTYKNMQKQIEEIKRDMEKKLGEISKTNTNPNLEYFLSTNFNEKKEKLYKEFENKLIRAIYYTANRERVGLVLSYEIMPYGGLDITEKVIENLDNNNFDEYPLFNNPEIVSYVENTNNLNKQTLEKILKEIYHEKKVYVVIPKNYIFLGGFDLNEKLSEIKHTKNPSKNDTK